MEEADGKSEKRNKNRETKKYRTRKDIKKKEREF
jgi:hypothetical protein